jgi:hypothetical protein
MGKSKFIVCFELARETRKRQKMYFADRNTNNLLVSKECEKALDQCIKEIETEAKNKGIEL